MTIIGLTGKAGAGKDTVAQYLSEHYGFEHLSFAAPLKAAVLDIFHLDPRQLVDRELKETVDEYWGMTPREIMQKIGTEAMRGTFGADIWVRSLHRSVTDAIGRGCPVVISDVRFDNEAIAISEWGGIVMRVDRDTKSTLSVDSQRHPSELGVSDSLIAGVFSNNATIPSLEAQVISFMEDLKNV